MSSNGAILMNCLFATLFAAAAVGVLSGLGVVVRSNNPCATYDNTYGSCEMWQDVRSLMSFAFGALFCCYLQRSSSSRCPTSETDETCEGEKLQLFACML
mmetsp:Transcript_86168/g.136017  ORF Transcript_86168/g.136017 Transcript_86168/m.136017 type:complete len:100 (+) Transcript_86168:94-393(+)